MTAEAAGERATLGTSCKDCGATVTSTDRFCPACGTPNANTRFHPKFGPALKIVEPRILSDSAPDGSPSCPRCQRQIAGEQEFCAGCGMELEIAWDRLHRVEALDVIRGDGDLAPYRAPGRLGTVLQASISLSMGLTLLVGLGNVWLYARSGGRLLQGMTTADVFQLIDVLSTAMFVSLGVSYGLLVGWMIRAQRNLPALAVGDVRATTRSVIAGWLVPGLNLIRPKRLMDELWRGSDPVAPPASSSWRVGPTTAWSTGWWAGLLVGLMLGVTAKLIQPTGVVSTATGQAPLLALASVSALLLIVSTMSLRVLVRRIGERQDTRSVLVLERGSELDSEEPFERAAFARHEPATGPVLLVQPSSRDAIYGKY